MDTLTHALSGALLVQALYFQQTQPASPKPEARPLPYWLWVLSGFLAGAFPDADAVSSLFGTLAYLTHHRGLTHSIFMIPLWAGLVALILSGLSLQRYRWQQFYLACFLAISIHIAGDVITAYGTMIFAPFSNIKVSWPVTFIIDLYFSGIILFSLLACALVKRHRQKIALAGMLILVSYVAAGGLLRQQALNIAQQYASSNNIDIKQHPIAAIAQPLSPFNWKLMILQQDIYHIAYVDLLHEPSENLNRQNTTDSFLEKVSRLYQPVKELEWQRYPQFGNQKEDSQEIQNIWQSEVLFDIRQFMMFPVLSRVVKNEQGYCAWFADQRFILGDIRTPFQFGACHHIDRSWDLVGLKDNRMIKIK
ncbi:MAG: metal-dependent hydrolase [Gammaproteobacteria bacterium]|nr:metal-dependent hydrolase [Gammaproteobacteria bacterium]